MKQELHPGLFRPIDDTEQKLQGLLGKVLEEFPEQGAFVLTAKGNGQLSWSSNLHNDVVIVFLRSVIDFIENRQ